MSRNNHTIEQEELMAYLDGELEMDRAVEAAAHLERCTECQELAADLRKLSQEMLGWEVEPSRGEEGLPAELDEALKKQEKKPRKRNVSLPVWKSFLIRRWQWIPGLTAVGLVIVLVLAPRLAPHSPPAARFEGFFGTDNKSQVDPNFNKLEHYNSENYLNGQNAPASAGKATTGGIQGDRVSFYSYDSLGKLSSAPSPLASSNGLVLRPQSEAKEETKETEGRADIPQQPMIARTAALSLISKEFEKTRASLEEVLRRHNGYIAELNVSAPAEAGRTLTAVLRVPAPQLEAALAEIKNLGRVEGESQGGEEVTQQYVDLAARLANAKHTELRLTEILRQRTGKLQDVLKVELEIDRVRGEIEQMEAEKKELAKRVAFATLNTTVKEEYQARLQSAPPSTGSRFRNAAVDGYNTVVEGLISVGLFLLSAGPSLLVWAAILFFPARLAWRKWLKKLLAQSQGDTEEKPAE